MNLTLTHKRKHSEETKQKIRQSLLGELNPFWGKKHTAETLKKIREARAKQVISPETCRKISESHRGEKNSF
jgi:hypothetical protein